MTESAQDEHRDRKAVVDEAEKAFDELLRSDGISKRTAYALMLSKGSVLCELRMGFYLIDNFIAGCPAETQDILKKAVGRGDLSIEAMRDIPEMRR